MAKIIALFGKSGAGKDTIQNILTSSYLKDSFHGIVSCTTRPIRENEVDGINYHYLTREEFSRRFCNDEFIEALEFNGWFYGALASDLDPERINIGVFTPSGIYNLFESASQYDLDIFPIYVQASDKVRFSRILNREENPDVSEMVRRYGTDEEDFTGIDFDYFVFENNDSLWRTNSDVVETIYNRAKAFFD